MAGPQEQFDEDEYELEPSEPVVRPSPIAPQLRSLVEPQVSGPKLPPPPKWPLLQGVFTFPFYLSTLATFIFGTIALLVASLVTLFCYHMLHVHLIVGRVIAIPTGLVDAVALSYLSASFLAVIEGTSEGFDAIEDWPDETWRDWFWTLPSTLGMVLAAGIIGYAVARLLDVSVWMPMGLSILVLHPIFQLSTLESDKLSHLVSLPIMRTFAAHPVAWGVFYAETFALALAFLRVVQLTFTWAPYITIAIYSPAATALLLIYFRLLGRLAWLTSQSPDGD